MSWFSDILNGLRRAITFPKSANSIDDILGSGQAAALAKQFAAGAVTAAIGGVFDRAVNTPLTRLETSLVGAICGAYSVLPTEVVTTLQARIEGLLSANVNAPLAKAEAAITADVLRFLQLSG